MPHRQACGIAVEAIERGVQPTLSRPSLDLSRGSLETRIPRGLVPAEKLLNCHEYISVL